MFHFYGGLIVTVFETESKLLALVLDLFDLTLRPTDALCEYGLSTADLNLLQRALSDFFNCEIDWLGTTTKDSIRQLSTHASEYVVEHQEAQPENHY